MIKGSRIAIDWTLYRYFLIAFSKVKDDILISKPNVGKLNILPDAIHIFSLDKLLVHCFFLDKEGRLKKRFVRPRA